MLPTALPCLDLALVARGGSCGCGFRFFVLRSAGGCGGWLSVPAVVPLVPPLSFLFPAVRLCYPAGVRFCVRGPVVGRLPLLWPEIGVGRSGAVFLLLGRGPVAAVVRSLWPGPVAGLGWVVHWCCSGVSCGQRLWSRRLGGFAGLWLSLLPSPAPLGWRVCPSGAGRPVLCGLFRQFPAGTWLGSHPPPLFFLFWGGFVVPLPLFGRRIHWLVIRVTNWLADRAAAYRCVVRGLGPCPGSLHRADCVHVRASGPSYSGRFWLFLQGGWAS